MAKQCFHANPSLKTTLTLKSSHFHPKKRQLPAAATEKQSEQQPAELPPCAYSRLLQLIANVNIVYYLYVVPNRQKLPLDSCKAFTHQ